MRKLNWKSLLLVGGVAAIGTAILLPGILSTLRLPLLGWHGLGSFVVLLVLTLLSGRFTVPVTNVDGTSQTHKSVADAFILLAVLMYTTAPANSVGPALILAAVVGFISSFSLSERWPTVFAVGTSVISTFVASLVYRFMVLTLAGGALDGKETALVLDLLLFPLCVFGFVQYSLSTFGTVAFNSFYAGGRVTVSKESLIWTLITQVANVTSAALFYSAIHGAGVPFLFVGALIIVLVHLLYRFNEKRVSEVTRAQADKVRYAEEIADLHMNTIESLAIAIDAKDQTTHGHVRRTQIYATEMGKLLKVKDQELRALVAGALLHDIGKLAVPEYILNKPGKLTEAEFAKMKIHPTVGGDILKRVNFPYPVEDIVRYHHEKWDGSGYPKGLKAEQIPLVARILSVVDFYDATRCDRPYRKGMKREDSLSLLQKMSASSFDPKVVDLFTKHVIAFDQLIDAEDIQEQVPSENIDFLTSARPDAGLA
jgi:putative nucleotidyltransferase with HDIG domain